MEGIDRILDLLGGHCPYYSYGHICLSYLDGMYCLDLEDPEVLRLLVAKLIYSLTRLVRLPRHQLLGHPSSFSLNNSLPAFLD